jgi:hypothetical protein
MKAEAETTALSKKAEAETAEIYSRAKKVEAETAALSKKVEAETAALSKKAGSESAILKNKLIFFKARNILFAGTLLWLFGDYIYHENETIIMWRIKNCIRRGTSVPPRFDKLAFVRESAKKIPSLSYIPIMLIGPSGLFHRNIFQSSKKSFDERLISTFTSSFT